MNERSLISNKINKISINLFDRISNEKASKSHMNLTSSIFRKGKKRQEQGADSSNGALPKLLNSDIVQIINLNNNINNYNLNTIANAEAMVNVNSNPNVYNHNETSIEKTKRTQSNIDNEEVLPNVLKPSYFNKINQTKVKEYDSKGTNLPSFACDDDTTTFNITKYKSIPWGFETSISFPINDSDNYMRYIKDQFALVKERNMLMKRHNSLKPTNFLNCFTSCMKNKLHLTTDIKNVIHNSTQEDYETRVKLIKGLIKAEIRNRSIGSGVSIDNNKFREKNKSKWKEEASQRRIDKEQNPIMINLKKKALFEKKDCDNSADICFNRKFLRGNYDSYMADKEKKSLEKTKLKDYNAKVVQLYSKVKTKRDADSHRDRKVLRAIKSSILIDVLKNKDNKA